MREVRAGYTRALLQTDHTHHNAQTADIALGNAERRIMLAVVGHQEYAVGILVLEHALDQCALAAVDDIDFAPLEKKHVMHAAAGEYVPVTIFRIHG